MITFIQQFHDGMRACVRPDEGICLDWFEVGQGLRQGCVLSPPLFDVFFAAVLTGILQKFSEDTIILAELVYLKGSPTSMGPEPAMDYVRHADVACIVSRSPQGLAKVLEIIVEVCRAFALTVRRRRQGPCAYLHHVHRGRWCESKRPGKTTNRYNHSPTIIHLPRGRCDRNPGRVRWNREGPAHAGCTSCDTYLSFTTNQK